MNVWIFFTLDARPHALVVVWLPATNVDVCYARDELTVHGFLQTYFYDAIAT
jgi:hypothetical protein